MTRHLLQSYADDYDMIVVFANTGEENEATLEFVRNCDEIFEFNTVWLETLTHPGKRKSSTHQIVTFDTASRGGEPFEAVIAKYGIPNMTHPHCTRELKRNPIESYIKSIEWDGCLMAIGIRRDESRRVTADASRSTSLCYPLVDWFPSDKQDVNDWWEEQPFTLELREHEGNCKWCWKKSFRKHARLIRETPGIYEFPRRMEAVYGNVGPTKEHEKHPEAFPRTFFRERTSTDALFLRCSVLEPWRGERERPDENGGCTESCELYPTEEAA